MGKLSMAGEVWLFLRQNKKLWLLPMVIVLLALGALLVFAQSSALAPFIYTIF
jgi:drug/metabolite transporter superfamily protein YnfA